MLLTHHTDTLNTYLSDANLRMAKLLSILTYLFLFCLVLFPFRLHFEPHCLNNCKMKRSKQRSSCDEPDGSKRGIYFCDA